MILTHFYLAPSYNVFHIITFTVCRHAVSAQSSGAWTLLRFGSFSSCTVESGWIFLEHWRESSTPPEETWLLGGGVSPVTGGGTELLGGVELSTGEGCDPAAGPANTAGKVRDKLKIVKIISVLSQGASSSLDYVWTDGWVMNTSIQSPYIANKKSFNSPDA